MLFLTFASCRWKNNLILKGKSSQNLHSLARNLACFGTRHTEFWNRLGSGTFSNSVSGGSEGQTFLLPQ